MGFLPLVSQPSAEIYWKYDLHGQNLGRSFCNFSMISTLARLRIFRGVSKGLATSAIVCWLEIFEKPMVFAVPAAAGPAGSRAVGPRVSAPNQFPKLYTFSSGDLRGKRLFKSRPPALQVWGWF